MHGLCTHQLGWLSVSVYVHICAHPSPVYEACPPVQECADPSATARLYLNCCEPLWLHVTAPSWLLSQGRMSCYSVSAVHIPCDLFLACCRTCPSPTTATYVLLLGIQRGYEAQAAAVDWILARDWPQKAEPDPSLAGPIGSRNSNLQAGQEAAQDSDSTSIDTQDVLGVTAAEAIGLADTASSSQPASQHNMQDEAAPTAQQPTQRPEQPPSLVVLLSRLQQLLRDWDPEQGCSVQLALAMEGLQHATGLPRHVLQDVVVRLVSGPDIRVSRLPWSEPLLCGC